MKQGKGVVSIVQKQIDKIARDLCQPFDEKGEKRHNFHSAALVIVPHPLDDNGQPPEGKPPYLVGRYGHTDHLYMSCLYTNELLRPDYFDEPEPEQPQEAEAE